MRGCILRSDARVRRPCTVDYALGARAGQASVVHSHSALRTPHSAASTHDPSVHEHPDALFVLLFILSRLLILLLLASHNHPHRLEDVEMTEHGSPPSADTRELTEIGELGPSTTRDMADTQTISA